MLLKKQVDDPQSLFYLSYCKYCGRPFIKTHNRIMYCSSECKCYALKEQKAIYQQKRRLLIKNGELISNENRELGTTFLSAHPKQDFILEEKAIKRELKRIGV